MPVRLAVAAVPELSVFSDLQFGGVGGGDAVAGLHAVALLQLGQGAHQAGVGSIQRCYALLLHTHMQTVSGTYRVNKNLIYVYRQATMICSSSLGWRLCKSLMHICILILNLKSGYDSVGDGRENIIIQ